MPSHRLPTIIVLYDHDCPLQRIELLALKANDQLNQIKLINIRDAQFSAHAWGFAPQALATTLHVRDLAGHWHIDMDAIGLLYRAVGLPPPLEPNHRYLQNHGRLPDLRFVFGKLKFEQIYGFIGESSNDGCLITKVNDNNS